MKDVTFRTKALEKVVRGMDITCDAIVGTLGPRGLNAYIDEALAPIITNDGSTIATSIDLSDKLENLGCKVVKNTSGQTNDDAGDGTTTTACLLQDIVHECLKRPENPMDVSNSLKEATHKIISQLKKQSIKIDSKDIKRVALISAENEQIASIVSEIIHKIGEDAVITVEDSKSYITDYDIVEGYEAGVGFLSTAFITEPKRARAVMEDVPVFVSERKISTIQDIAPMFEYFKTKSISQAVIVCEEIENSILGILVNNKLMGNFNSIVIRATGDVLKDIEAAVGAKRVSDVTGSTFALFKAENLGFVKKIVSDANKTLFIPKDTSSAILWSNHLQKFANEEPNMYIKQRLERRISQLRGGVAVLRIGAHTDFEREYLKKKAEDAIKASKAALEEGIVEGGGMALWRIAQDMKPKTIGENILKKSLTTPLRKILENANKDYADIMRDLPDKMGYDAKKDIYVDMIKSGIIDPTKVERCAIENAISNAATLITTFVTITDAEPKTTK